MERVFWALCKSKHKMLSFSQKNPTLYHGLTSQQAVTSETLKDVTESVRAIVQLGLSMSDPNAIWDLSLFFFSLGDGR